MKKFSIIISLFVLLSNTGWSDHVSSAGITKATLAAIPQCMHYKLEGACFWIDQLGVVSSTPYIDQYLPDVVVSVFNKPGDNPWTEMNISIDQAGKAMEYPIVQTAANGIHAGYGQHSIATEHEQSVYFKEADIIGNPALAVFDHALFLPSTATPLLPYFQSMTDAVLWRGLTAASMPEKVMAVPEDIVRHIGTFPINWGSVFPIEGKVFAGNDAKASAVIAQRAVNLLTSSPIDHLPLHVFKSLSNDCGEHCEADAFHENDDHTQFQRIYPDPQNSCEVFGKTLNYGDEGLSKKANGAYVWIVWRHYRGCVHGEGEYIGRT